MTLLPSSLRSFPRVSLFVGASTILASCLCNGAPDTGCGNITLTPTCDAGAPVAHGHLTGSSFIFSCAISCDDGYFDCDGRHDDGCESTTKCPNPFDPDSGKDAAPPVTTATLADAPRGLAVCDGVAYVLDGDVVKTFTGASLDPTSIAFLDAPAAGGLACAPEGGVVLLEMGTDGSAPALVRITPDASAPLAVAGDPGAGILADDGGIFWPEKDDAGAHLVQFAGDAATPLGPIDLTGIDKTFARGASETYAITDGGVVTFGDASVPTWDGGTLNAVAAGNGLTATGPGADGGSVIVGFDDAGVAFALATSPTRVLRVLRRDGGVTFVGYDDAVSSVSANGFEVPIALGQLHVTDLAVDATWVYWTTLGGGGELSAIHRVKR